jgi:cellulose synthase/poly-beta-1,6-N-acetylglucosamine synthase-like glycosyltransferase
MQRGRPVSQTLIDTGAVSPQVMLGALAEATRLGQPVGPVLAAEGLASFDDVLDAEASCNGTPALRRSTHPPDPALGALLPAAKCLEYSALPWMRIDKTLVVATARPEDFDTVRALLPPDTGAVTMALATEADIHAEIAERHGAALARRAETWRPEEESCRDINRADPVRRRLAAAIALSVLGFLAFAPTLFFAIGVLVALGSLVFAQALKLAALAAAWRRPIPAPRAALPEKPPTVSILVPLFREPEIATTLVARLQRLTYPKSLLDVVLVLEEEDACTRAALARTRLPPWCRVVEVPPGSVTTKPRALNYAFGFTRGAIIGIYDAEDAPAADQIDRVVAQFGRSAQEVACLQGILDFYNPRANWLSRCFAIEYAGWFRVILPGLVRLGFPIPLGGTTVFFRRAALERVCGWDAHNVTEDADLGIRLARKGYRTELVPSVTREEANNRFWPWIRQRSRWLKGYAITWWAHARRPRALWRELGPRRFAGMQLIFLTALLQFALAPLLWSFWLVLFGLPHPFDPWLDRQTIIAMTAVFLSAEAISIVIGLAAVARSPHGALLGWVPTLFAYFPLGTLAIYKGIWETARNPFYWDKTQHGRSAPDAPGADLPETRV